MSKYDFYKDTEGLKRLISENPDLPICVLVAGDISFDSYEYTYAGSVSYSVEEILDNDEYMNDECVINEREKLEEELEDRYYDELVNMNSEEQDAFIAQKMKELEPYWKKVIAIRANSD